MGRPSGYLYTPIQVALPQRAKYLVPAWVYGCSIFTSLAPMRYAEAMPPAQLGQNPLLNSMAGVMELG